MANLFNHKNFLRGEVCQLSDVDRGCRLISAFSVPIGLVEIFRNAPIFDFFGVKFGFYDERYAFTANLGKVPDQTLSTFKRPKSLADITETASSEPNLTDVTKVCRCVSQVFRAVTLCRHSQSGA